MLYILTFTCCGTKYATCKFENGAAAPKQYEAVAVGLLLGKLEAEGLKRDSRCTDLCLLESEGTPGSVLQPVWVKTEFYPISEEMK